MKRIIALLCSFLVLYSTSALASDLDLTSYSIDELLALKGQISEELDNRGYYTEEVIPGGMYGVGLDLSAGTYDFRIADGDEDSVTIYLYKGTKENPKQTLVNMWIVGSAFTRLELEEGMYVGVSAIDSNLLIKRADTSSSIFNP